MYILLYLVIIGTIIGTLNSFFQLSFIYPLIKPTFYEFLTDNCLP